MPINAFIIRPFGKKDVIVLKDPPPPDKNQPGAPRETTAKVVQIDFQRIQDDLITPALRQLKIEAKTTEVILASGNIREDMFHLLMTADLVLADVSLQNPNVYYELGIRHAFRDKFTFLIRSNLSDVPFDLKTDRYFEYDHTRLDQKSVNALAKALRATLNSERSDSPVFRLLPRMRAEDRSRFINVPRDFQEELDRAKKYRRAGDLRLLAAECEGFLWEVEGLRGVGRAQFELNYIAGACATFEGIVRRYPDDVEANMILSTVYQRRSDSARSEQALARVSRQQFGDANTLAEIQSLVGRNLRARWQQGWEEKKNQAPQDDAAAERQKRALRSPFLRRAYEAYAASFRGNLNYAYSGINALSLLLIELSLGSRYPSDWHVVSKRAGDREDRRQEAERLTSVLSYTIDCERENLERENRIDFWFFSLRATFLALTCDNPRMVEQAYREAVAYAPRYTEESMRRGLEMYRTLRVEHFNSAIRLQENVDCALAVIRGDEQASRTPPNVVLFAGLRMEPQSYTVPDTAEDGGMKTMRYLPPQAKDWARDQIKAALQREKAKLEAKGQPGARLIGLAAGSSGADLLFHDTCHDLDIETRMYLALPKDQYVGQYVSEAGPDWVESFNAVYARLHTAHNDYTGDCVEREVESPIHVLAENDELPRWLQSLDNYSIGRRTEVWMLQHALVQRSMHGSGTEVTLIVLWAKNKARSGGLHHLVELAARNGVKVLTIDCAQWDKDQPAPKADAAKA